jgi:hypothetical protein
MKKKKKERVLELFPGCRSLSMTLSCDSSPDSSGNVSCAMRREDVGRYVCQASVWGHCFAGLCMRERMCRK